MINFRTRSHKLPVETGSWHRIPLNLRICTKCNNGIGDEFHYLFECSFLLGTRKRLLKAKYYNRPNIIIYKELMENKCFKKVEYRKFCELVKEIICLYSN